METRDAYASKKKRGLKTPLSLTFGEKQAHFLFSNFSFPSRIHLLILDFFISALLKLIF
jgi:hypothetical protein